MEMSKLSDSEFKTPVIRILKELSEGLNSMKKTEAEMKDVLMEIKNNIQGINSRMDEAENQSDDMGQKERRGKKKNNQNNKKKKEI